MDSQAATGERFQSTFPALPNFQDCFYDSLETRFFLFFVLSLREQLVLIRCFY